jgi:hypothetical protein
MEKHQTTIRHPNTNIDNIVNPIRTELLGNQMTPTADPAIALTREHQILAATANKLTPIFKRLLSKSFHHHKSPPVTHSVFVNMRKSKILQKTTLTTIRRKRLGTKRKIAWL